MKLHEHAFRDLFHQFILLPIDKNDPHIPDFFKEFPNYHDANALLLYGYIDHEAGLTFEVLSAARHENDTTTLFPEMTRFQSNFALNLSAMRKLYYSINLRLMRMMKKLSKFTSSTKPTKVLNYVAKLKSWMLTVMPIIPMM